MPPGATSPLPMPQIRGGTVFAIMGDSGSGDQAQQAVAQAMLTYFNTARRFPFVLMLGDNLYDDDYTNEFSVPYKPLLDRGVKFYAALGNHDRDLEIHFKPFNMNDVDRYSFDEGNARFAVLNSNHPADPLQLKWLDQVYADAGTKWRIAFFHHPLYSSGQHAAEEPRRDPAGARTGARAQPGGRRLQRPRAPLRADQAAARHPHFVSGGGGRYLYEVQTERRSTRSVCRNTTSWSRRSPATGCSSKRSRHSQEVIDCGVLYRTSDAAGSKPDDTTTKWQAQCDGYRAKPRTTQH